MTAQEQTRRFSELVSELKEILRKKGKDYANDDVLSNFKDSAKRVGKQPEEQCLSLISTKVSRIANLLDKEPKNESLQDSIKDLLGYVFLLDCIITEKESIDKVVKDGWLNFGEWPAQEESEYKTAEEVEIHHRRIWQRAVRKWSNTTDAREELVALNELIEIGKRLEIDITNYEKRRRGVIMNSSSIEVNLFEPPSVNIDWEKVNREISSNTQEEVPRTFEDVLRRFMESVESKRVSVVSDDNNTFTYCLLRDSSSPSN